MKKYKATKWARAECNDCSWELESVNAQAVAARHAKAHKHKVFWTVEYSSHYDGAEEP